MANQWIKVGNISNTEVYLGVPAKGDDLAIEMEVTPEYFINSIHPQEAIFGKHDAKGELNLPLKPKDGIDELIFAFFGQVQSTDNGNGTYTHTFTAKEKDIPEFDIIKNVGTLQEKYTGCKAVKLAITSPASGEIEFSVGIIAKDGSIVSGETEGTYDGSKTFRVQNASITWGGVEYAVGNVEITIEREAADDGFALNSDAGRSLIPEGNLKISAKLDVLADDVTFAQDFLAGTQKALVLTLQTLDGETIAIHIPNGVITSRAKATQVEKGLLIEEVEIIGLDDGVNGAGYIELTNDVPSYPRT